MSDRLVASQQPWRAGSPAERTSLAWVRTVVSIELVSGVGTRLALVHHHGWIAVIGVLGNLAGLVSVLLWWRHVLRARRSATPSGRLAESSPAAALSALVAVCMLGVVGLGLAIELLQ
jgi:uncharacterized membrane protein YidH (DUF202 family)